MEQTVKHITEVKKLNTSKVKSTLQLNIIKIMHTCQKKGPLKDFKQQSFTRDHNKKYT